jgi:glycosyltransferase involved in cell wall biosynthesis
MSAIHRIYGVLRPYLQKAGLLGIARRFVSKERREQIAVGMGLTGFMPPLEVIRAGRYTGTPTLDGINYVTDMRANIGLGVSARMMYRTLVTWSEATALPVVYHEVETPAVDRSVEVNVQTAADDSADEYDITIMNLIPPEMRFAIERYSELLKRTYNINYWMWEVPKLPDVWASAFPLLDEIWVGSTYTGNILRKLTDLPVIYIPTPVEVSTSGQSADETRIKFGLPTDRFIFFFVFNPSSSMARKNPYALIEAYRRAFGDSQSPDKPLLVIKTHHLSALINAVIEPKLRAAVDSVGGVLIDGDFTRTEMNDLLSACDCFVSLHRAEGFGLGIAEAMALGRPVIATGYSANMDFMSSENSYPIGYTLTPITWQDHEDQPLLQQVYTPGEGQVWAEPDVDEAASLMRHVVAHPDEAQQRGERARRDILEGWSVQAVSQRIGTRLNEIAQRETQPS